MGAAAARPFSAAGELAEAAHAHQAAFLRLATRAFDAYAPWPAAPAAPPGLGTRSCGRHRTA
eukprot:11051553-Alexandrium_andersonii.AAC.1